MRTPRSFARLVRSLALVAVLTLSVSVSAFAENVVGTASVIGGALSLGTIEAPSVGVTLDGTDQTPTDTFAIPVNDRTGTGAGWKVEITSTTFTDGSKSLPTTASTITNVTSAVNGEGTYTNPSNSVSYVLTVPADATAPAPVVLFNAAAGTGLGDFTLTPTLAVDLPANTLAGNYSSTITLSLTTGP